MADMIANLAILSICIFVLVQKMLKIRDKRQEIGDNCEKASDRAVVAFVYWLVCFVYWWLGNWVIFLQEFLLGETVFFGEGDLIVQPMANFTFGLNIPI